MAWYKVADTTTKGPGLWRVSAGGKSICLVHHDGQWFAVAANCPYAGADLSQGWCDNGQVICPFHRYRYDLSSGRGATGQNDYVRTYATEVRSDGVYVQVRSLAERLFGK